MTKRCGTCRHWRQKDQQTMGDDIREGVCSCEKFIYHAGNERPGADTAGGYDDCLFYCDHECYGAEFSTGATFGCIHWKNNHG